MPSSIGPRSLRLWRWLVHGLHSSWRLRRTLDDSAMARLQNQVAASEARHSGEIRLVIETGLPLSYLWKRLSARDRAITLFGKLRVWDTERNNGVLIYLLLAEHRIEIVADRGLDRLVGGERWHQMLATMRRDFVDGAFERGLSAAVQAVDALLVQHFPLAPGEINPNELPDAPLRLG